MPPAEDPSPHVRRLGWALIALVALCGAALAAELALRAAPIDLRVLARVVAPASAGDSRAYVLRPATETPFRGMQEALPEPVAWRVNAQGIRADAPVGPPGARFRVLVFGDSEAFGWAVPIEATFQREMERRDPRIEVINLGVPGYNLENIADYMEEAVPALRPDLVFYLFHPNDLDPPLTLSPWLVRSQLYLALNLAWSIVVYDGVKARRESPEAAAFVESQVARMIALARREAVGLQIGFLHPRWALLFPAQLRHVGRRERAQTEPWAPGFRLLRGLSLWRARLEHPRTDHHMSAAGHAYLAGRVCEALAGAADAGCVPPGWHAGLRPQARRTN